MHILQRDDAMVLYGPGQNSIKKQGTYEIILQRPHTDTNTTSFSLYRAPSYEDVLDKFNTFMSRLPVFVRLVKEVKIRHNIFTLITKY